MTPPHQITPIILCGGAGTRLWPLSRKSYPKQFSKIIGDRSLFQDCALRLTGAHYDAPLVITGDAFRFVVAEQLAQVGVLPGAILIEPTAKDTAPALLAASLYAQRSNPEALVLVAPSDHLIPDAAGFADTVNAAVPAAMAGQIVTFGVPPTRPETGYGYLQTGEIDTSQRVQRLCAFVEKPDRATAKVLVGSGNALWNAGIYLAKVKTLRAAFRAYASDILAQVETSVAQGRRDLGFYRLAATAWDTITPLSVDYAVMEKARNLSVIRFDGGWSDLGDWDAVWRATQQGGVAASGSATALDCTNTLLRSEVAGQTVVGIGLDDIIAVAMPDAVLISHKSRTQDVKQAVGILRAQQQPQAETYPKDHRPWGWFESLASGARFQVKRIRVKPGAALSLQSHHHRAEHWIVVAGTARVTVGNRVELVSENQSIYIPLGTRHRLENPGKVPVTLIEVQTGAYLGEDDIIRYEDLYARG